MASLRLVGINKKFGRSTIIDHLTLEVSDGEFLAILGPSGTGKTTILRMIAGLEYPSKGEIFIGGKAVNNVHPRDRDVAMVFQNYALYNHMSVYENLAFPLRMRKLTKTEIRNRVLEVANLLQLTPLLLKQPTKLSGGEKQRVAMGRAIIRRPQLFLYDEPLSNLDAQLRQACRQEIKNLHRGNKVTTIYVTHDQVEALSLSDRVAVISQGVLQQVGTPLEIYHNPANLFVAQFVGKMNILKGRLYGFRVITDNGSLALPDKACISKEYDPNKTYVIGIRPEDINISRDTNPGNNQSTEAVVDAVETIGPETYVYLSVNGSTITARHNSPLGVTLGQKVNIQVSSNIHIFDLLTGGRVNG